MKIKFCGAASGVTGSCHLITTQNHKLLLDCGQFQGNKAMDIMNFEEFPFDPFEVEYVVLSHAHIDHCGRIPLLVKRGFKGEIICTDATADLLDVMLKDSGYIHEKEAEQQNRKNKRAGRPLVEPLYTFNDAVDSLKYVEPVLYDQLIELNDEISICFNDAGHILGSAEIELWVTERNVTGTEDVSKIVFSGDLGVQNRPILRDPTIIKKADHVIMETTYGNRLHPANSTSIDEMMKIVSETVKRGGTVVIPSFAVGRTQELLFEFNKVYDDPDSLYAHILKDVPVYVDSPMAANATEVFKNNAQVFDEETKDYLSKGDNPLDFKGLSFTRTTQESQNLNMDETPKIIISASGMCEAGRIRHHLKHNLWNEKSSIVFVGYQAEGTLGRYIIDGAEHVKLFGDEIQVKAQIHNLEGLSGHADKNGLLSWLRGFQKAPNDIFLVHGEPEAKEDFAKTVKEELGYDPVVVKGVSEFELSKDRIVSREEALEDALDFEVINDTRRKLADIHNRLEDIIYNTDLIMGSALPPERVAAINNVIQELDKSTINLGSAIIDSYSDDGIEAKAAPIQGVKSCTSAEAGMNK